MLTPVHTQVLVTVFSRPQLGAILGKMEKEAAERWDRKLSERGQPGRCAAAGQCKFDSCPIPSASLIIEAAGAFTGRRRDGQRKQVVGTLLRLCSWMAKSHT